MTKEEAERIQELVDTIIETLGKNDPPSQGNWSVNWGDLSCRDVLVSALHPNDPPVIKIEEVSPDAWGFAQAVADALEEEHGIRAVVETEW